MTDWAARAGLVKRVNRAFAGFTSPPPPEIMAILVGAARETGASIRVFIEASEPHLPDVPDPLDRLNITLRLWSGCLLAAKGIALETLDGPNTPEGRRAAFADIDEVARNDAIFEVGVESAPAFKGEEPVCFDGVPEHSPVRRYSG
jgi:hypothetical protein